MELFWELHQAQGIKDAKVEASSAKTKVEILEDRVQALERRADRHTLLCQAMWELIRDHTGWADEQILQRLGEIDLRDGQLDGKIGAQIIDCPNCAGKINSKRGYCMLCGTEAQAGELFES